VLPARNRRGVGLDRNSRSAGGLDGGDDPVGGLGVVDIVYDDLRALLAEVLGDRGANGARRARDYSDFPCGNFVRSVGLRRIPSACLSTWQTFQRRGRMRLVWKTWKT
jgi:hypothetical protein